MIFGLNHTELLVAGAGFVLLAFMFLVAVSVIKGIKTGKKDIFQHEDIEELLKPEIRKLVEYWGSKTSMDVRYRYDVKGTVYKQLDYTSDITESDSKNRKRSATSVDIDQEQLEKDYEDGKISERIYRAIKEFGQEPVHILLVRPSGLIGKWRYILFEQVFSISGMVSRIMVVPERLIRDDVDYLTILNQAEFTRFVGMDVAVEASAFNFVESIGFKNLYSQALQDQQNYHKQVNFYASRFTQELQKLEKEAEVENQKWSGRNAGMVNEG